MTLKEQVDRAVAAARETWDILGGPFTIVDDRSQLLLAYASVALEHHAAIVMLASSGLTGSAFALIRPVFEVLYRSLWVYYCAKPNEVEKIKAGKFRFPEMGEMVAAIDASYGDDFFSQFKALAWNDQNDFTHTGRLQISSRLTQEKFFRAAYPEELVAAQINSVTMAAILVPVLLLKTHSRMEDGERLERVLMRFNQASGEPEVETKGCGDTCGDL